jgi:CubicO group peptidase (beta-lactamase class C family)
MNLPERLQAAMMQRRERPRVGLQAAVYHGEELVAEACAGHADAARTRAVDGETLFTVFSATKAVAALAVHIQAERGLLEYDRSIAQYWPEFGAHGKQGTTVRDALLHRCGVPQMPAVPARSGVRLRNGGAIAALNRLCEPGTRSGYHAHLRLITGELVRRTDRRADPSRSGFRRDLCAARHRDLWLGIPDAAEPRVAEIIDLPPETLAAIPTDSAAPRSRSY